MFEKYKGKLSDLTRESQKTIKNETTTFYRLETADGYGYDIRYRSGYGIQFSKMNFHQNGNTWQGYLIEKTANGWCTCYNSPLGQCSYEKLSDEAVVELCKQLRMIA